jgi:hypothetical protein
VLPRSANRAFIAGLASAALISLLSVPMISAGVFLGAPMPIQKLASNPGRKSAKVGRSGSAAERLTLVTARAEFVRRLREAAQGTRVYMWAGDVFKPANVYSIDELRAARQTSVARDDDKAE